MPNTAIKMNNDTMPRHNGAISTHNSEVSPLLAAAASSSPRLADGDHADLAIDSDIALESANIQHDRVLSPYHATGRERTIAYLCFLIMGASVLLPWNLLIVVTPYFNVRLSTPTTISTFATSFVPLIYTLANLILIVRATYSQQTKGFDNIERKLFTCIAGMAGIIAVLAISTKLEIPHWLFYMLLLSVSIFGAGVTASLQSSSAALTTIFDDPFFMQGVMSGQGAIGFAVSITQFLAALNSEKQQTEQPIDAPPDSTLPKENDKLISSTYNFFLVSLLFTAIAAIATYVLIKMPMYKDAMERHEKIEEAGLATDEYETSGFPKPAHQHQHQHQHHKGSIWDVNRKIQGLGCALAYIYVVSIGLFPSITSAVQAVNKDRSFSSSLLWVPLGFVIFNTTDWIGRALPGFQALIFTNKRNLILGSAGRTIFIPLIMLCNVQLSSTYRIPIINSDTAYIIILICFALSNGYLTALLMMRAITEKNLRPEEVDVASSIMIIYLTVGLCLGAVLSVFLQAIAK